MRPESAKRIIDAYYDVFDELSIQTFKQGIDLVLAGLEDRLRAIRPIRTREGYEAMLLKEPEPEPFALDAQIEAIYLLPYTLRKVIPEAMRDFAKVFPHDPGGRPRALEDGESQYVCEEIGKLIARGVRLRDAQSRLALRMGGRKGREVSLRSVQRAWQARAKWFKSSAEHPQSQE